MSQSEGNSNAGQIWAAVAGGAAVIFLLIGANIPAVLMGLSAIVLWPTLHDMFNRYDLVGPRRNLVVVALSASAFLVHLTGLSREEPIPDDPNQADQSADAAVDAGQADVGDSAQADAGVSGDAAQAQPDPSFDTRLEPLTGCAAIDGDTLECGSERVRLLGVDAPEMPGHCDPSRACVPGNPFQSRQSLQEWVLPVMAIQRLGQDRFGRTIAMVYTTNYNLSCQQLRSGQAEYIEEWDDGGVLKSQCPVNPG